MTAPLQVPLVDQLCAAGGDELKAAHAARLRELRRGLERLLRRGLRPDEFAVAECLIQAVAEAERILSGLPTTSQPLTGRGMPGFLPRIQGAR